MVRFDAITESVGDDAAEENRRARGEHRVILEDADFPSLLAQAQELLAWGEITAQQPLPNLAFGDFAEIVLTVLKNTKDAHGGVKVETNTINDQCMDRVWKEILKGLAMMGGDAMANWQPCSKGAFKARLRSVQLSPAVDVDALELRDTDFYEVPALAGAPDWYGTLRWNSASFPGGFETIGHMEGYSVERCSDSGTKATESALAAYIALSEASTTAAAVRSGLELMYVRAMRNTSKAALVVKHWEDVRWPGALERWAQLGPEREVDALSRVAYMTSGGVGAAAEKIVLGRIESITATPPFEVIGLLLKETSASSEQVVHALRRVQQVFNIAGHDNVRVHSNYIGARALGVRAAVVAPMP